MGDGREGTKNETRDKALPLSDLDHFLASIFVFWSVSITQLSVIVSSLLLLFLVITQ